jgi:hypothetical protein
MLTSLVASMLALASVSVSALSPPMIIDCFNIVRLVCGIDGKTYNNVCEAQRANVQVKYDGKCSCICAAINAPVCADMGAGKMATISNRCQAKCAGVINMVDGACPQPGTQVCPSFIKEVCGIDGKTYRNACEAQRANVKVKSEGKCVPEPPCICPSIISPVCGAKSDGKMTTFPNRCQAKCAGVVAMIDGACDKDRAVHAMSVSSDAATLQCISFLAFIAGALLL